MPRISRAIAVGYPHHITQRGNYRQKVFVEEEDYRRYLELLSRYSKQHDFDVWAYCLMPNHVHIVGVPWADDSLANVFRNVHMLYSQYFNRKADVVGHLWQGRFYSCVLDERHLYAAVRYVELNPVRAGLVASALDYPWSSTNYHVNGGDDRVISGHCLLDEIIPDWHAFLREPQDTDAQDDLVKSTKTGRPCGTDDFKAQLEKLLGRRFTPRSPGRPRVGKNRKSDAQEK